MIKVNLAKKRKASGSANLGDLKSLDLASLFARFRGEGGDGEKKFDINGPLPKFIVAMAICYVVNMAIDNFEQETLKAMDVKIASIQKEKEGIQAKLARIKGFEPLKAQLEADEQAIRAKLECVQKLTANRNVAARMLAQLSQSIPEESWLTELHVAAEEVKLRGGTSNYNQVSDFIRSLKETPQLGEVALTGVQETTDQDQSHYQSFEISAKRRTDK